jgi:hypothetical protein
MWAVVVGEDVTEDRSEPNKEVGMDDVGAMLPCFQFSFSFPVSDSINVNGETKMSKKDLAHNQPGFAIRKRK